MTPSTLPIHSLVVSIAPRLTSPHLTLQCMCDGIRTLLPLDRRHRLSYGQPPTTDPFRSLD